MSTTTIIIVAVIVLALIAVLSGRSRGPRVTQIERTIHREDDDAEGRP